MSPITLYRKYVIWTVAVFALPLVATAQSTSRKVIQKEDDLPRFAYPVKGSVQDLLNADDAALAKFSEPVRMDIEDILTDYEIADHATLRDLLSVRLDFQMLSGHDDQAAIQNIQRIRSLEDKPSAKLLTYLTEEAILKARSGMQESPNSCPAAYETLYRTAVQSLPWETVATQLKGLKGFVGIVNKNLIAGQADTALQPMVAQSHSLSLPAAERLLGLRAAMITNLPCKQPTLTVLAAYIAAHDITKPDIWSSREIPLPPTSSLHPVNVAIWDSGFDTSLFAGRLLTDSNPGPNDPHGIAFDVFSRPTHGELIPLTPQQQNDYKSTVDDTQGLADLENNVDSPAADIFKKKIGAMSPAQVRALFEERRILGGYVHGTHVTGIAAQGNPAIRLAYARMTYDNGNPHMPPTDDLQNHVASSYAASVNWFRSHGIRVVNMSWWDSPSNIEKDLADNGIGKNAAERKQLARHYFTIERDGLYNALKGAPEILFVTIAGNSDANNAFEECVPSSFNLPNLIVTGAVDQAGDETSFTSYGDNVAVHANGLLVESLAPGGAKIKISGTSMAAPQITNLAAKLLALDPSLTPPQVISLIREGSDVSSDGRRHLANPKRSAELLEQRSH